ncbi:MAG TPA: molybdopterin-dependent oxidoreductase [Chloroflexota bacterium]|jgi:DMSO/TMAO reductase YedYZ molybdopterin-dependent catalytic subunit
MHHLTEYNSRRFGFAAGLAAAAIMLLAIALLRALSGVSSLPEIVAEGILARLPGALFSTVLDALQHAAKPLFYVTVGIGMLVVGGLLGRWYGAQPGWTSALRLVIGTWLVFGLVVYTVLGAGIFGQALSAGPIWHGLSLLVVFTVFGVSLVELHALLAQRDVPNARRRALLRNIGATMVGTLALGSVWRLMSTGFETTGAGPVAGGPRLPATPNVAPFDLKGISSEVTPTSDFYTVSKNFIDPSVAASSWRLKIDGLVDRPLELTYDELQALPASEGYYTLMCISNEVGGDLWGNAVWRGVKLRYLLEQAGVHPDGVKAVFSAADDYKDSVKLDRALHPDTLLAWEMNGAPLAREHGFPARLLIPGIYGMKNVKWLTGITILATDFKGFWQNQGWDDAAPYQTASRIDVPFSRATLAAGPVSVGGAAFAGDRGIQSVEVSTDQGRTWQPGQVKPGLSPYTWQLWRADLTVDKAVRDIRVRAVDGRGVPQLREEAPPFPSGSTGYHAITVAVS